jgi:hypothetical protein
MHGIVTGSSLSNVDEIHIKNALSLHNEAQRSVQALHSALAICRRHRDRTRDAIHKGGSLHVIGYERGTGIGPAALRSGGGGNCVVIQRFDAAIGGEKDSVSDNLTLSGGSFELLGRSGLSGGPRANSVTLSNGSGSRHSYNETSLLRAVR